MKARRPYTKHPVCNKDIRILMIKNEVTQVEIAKYLNYSYGGMSGWYAHEMSEEQKDQVIQAIKEIKTLRGESYEE